MTKLLWTQRANFGPSPREGSGMAYDSNRARTVLFGGTGAEALFSPLGDTWEWDGSFWTQMQDVGPAPRNAFGAMAYDSARQATVLFGGAGADRQAEGGAAVPRPFGDTWQWDGSDWTQISDTGPAARYDHALAFDSGRNRFVLFGGRGQGATLSDTWEFDGENWTQLGDVGPPARYGHAMSYDGAGRVVLFGGTGQQIFGDTWAWDGQEWKQIAEFGPSARCFAAVASMSAGNLVLYGGESSSQAGEPKLADTWQFDGKRWTERQDIGPGPLASAAMILDGARKKIVLFGGNGPAPATESGSTWEAAVAPQAAPSTLRVVNVLVPPNVPASHLPGSGKGYPSFIVTLSGRAPAGGSAVNITTSEPIFDENGQIGAVTVPEGFNFVETTFAWRTNVGPVGKTVSVSAEIPGTPAVSTSFLVSA